MRSREQVGRGEAELTATGVAPDHDPLDPVRPAERGRGRNHVTRINTCAYVS